MWCIQLLVFRARRDRTSVVDGGVHESEILLAVYAQPDRGSGDSLGAGGF